MRGINRMFIASTFWIIFEDNLQISYVIFTVFKITLFIYPFKLHDKSTPSCVRIKNLLVFPSLKFVIFYNRLTKKMTHLFGSETRNRVKNVSNYIFNYIYKNYTFRFFDQIKV